MIRETERKVASGGLMLTVLLLGTVAVFYGLINAVRTQAIPMVLLSLVGLVAVTILWFGLFTVQPNQSRVLQLFGDYVGSVRRPGLWWANPFFTKKAVSLRVRNFETTKLKVNDHGSNPIEIGAVVVWQVTDAAEALFEVDNFEDYVKVQSESALRGLANQYPYDAHEEGTMSLSTNTQDVAERLKVEIQERLAKAGVKVQEARISHLAYAPEIAGVMLPPPAGLGGDRGPAEDRGWRRGHGGVGAGAALGQADRPPRRGAEGCHGKQPPRGALLRAGHAAGGQRRQHLLMIG